MPRSFSSAIQSEVACRAALRPFTLPAIWIAPPNSSSFSVNVVLPASGCEMMANVRRRAVSCPGSIINLSVNWLSGGLEIALEHDGVFAPVGGLIIPAANADLFESEALVQPDGGQVARPDFQEGLADAGRGRTLQQVLQQAAAEAEIAELVAHADIEYVRLARADAHDAVADDAPREVQRAAGVAHAQAVAKDVLAPGKRIARLLDGGDLGQVDFHHRPDQHLRRLAHVFAGGGHLVSSRE